ncbi:DUF3017 domain-containing protein [Nocardiopsis tropica]|uniref:DUF3017 domain-containing protein n=1 Tax=Nocardiopsis tropica TaxID=109330 RepID=A0ABU7KMX5_9ACTN|nr:DUF3017 domain-containing protein [Nocardiopsis umidischolae]MEE2050369.1 DUF3017 domain-containing protein [Nocardiopsis umidischolae]
MADTGGTRDDDPRGAGPDGARDSAEGPEGGAADAVDTPPDGGPREPGGAPVPAADAEALPGAAGDGGQAGPAVPYWLSQVPYMLVMSALAAGIVVVAAAYFKRGPAIIAGALLLAAAFRLFLPKDWIGMLAVRRRWIDLLTLVGLAVLLIVLAWVAPQLSS